MQQNQGAVPLRVNLKGEEEEEKEQEEGHGDEGGRETEAWRREEILSSFSWGDSAGVRKERVCYRDEKETWIFTFKDPLVIIFLSLLKNSKPAGILTC